jgi:exopolysaccharide biosynthesis polyprenyl glycosylphosphotransferase
MLRRFSTNYALASMLVDAVLVALGLRMSVLFRPLLNGVLFFEPIGSRVVLPAALYVFFPIIWVVVFSTLSIYDGKKFLRVVDEFTALSLAMVFASISAAGILYVSFRDVSRALFISFIILVYLLCLIWRTVARMYFRTQNIHPDRVRRILIVGAGPLGKRIQNQLLEGKNPNLIFEGFIDQEMEPAQESSDRIGLPGAIRELVGAREVSDVVIALPHSAYNQMVEIIQLLEALPVQVWLALGFFDITLYNTAVEDFAGIPMLDLRASAINDYQRMVKRAFDLCFGLIALVLSLPLLAASALMIFLEDGSPVLFRQKRAGENGRLFEMLKFRTMVKNAEQLQAQMARLDPQGNLIHKIREDPRVTRVGWLLRRFSLDELPQFINVVRGDMSLVGPRPELPYLVEKYQPWQRKRFAVPPGLTGWWQVSGRSDNPMHLHTEDDLYYIQNYSIWLDVQILVRTIWVVLIGRGSY